MGFFTTSDLNELRVLQESAMEDACRIVHPDAPTFDEASGEFSTPGLTLVYQGKCRVTPSSRSQAAVGQEVTPWRTSEVYLPWDSPTPRVDDLLTITAALDPEVAGRTGRIIDVRVATYGASRKVTIETLAPGAQTPEV